MRGKDRAGIGNANMNVVIQLSRRSELIALPILHRHSPGLVVAKRTYVIRETAARALKLAGVPFTVLCWDAGSRTRTHRSVLCGGRKLT